MLQTPRVLHSQVSHACDHHPEELSDTPGAQAAPAPLHHSNAEALDALGEMGSQLSQEFTVREVTFFS